MTNIFAVLLAYCNVLFLSSLLEKKCLNVASIVFSMFKKEKEENIKNPRYRI